MGHNLAHIEKQLHKRLDYQYKWGRKQNNQWDSYTNFIYEILEWEALIDQMRKTVEVYRLDKHDLFNYAANRWFNFWSAVAIEQIFTQIPGVVPAINPKNRLVDFNCFGIDFDHKTTVFPKNFRRDLAYAKTHKKELIKWLYQNQSQQGRKHLKNRLFIVVYSTDDAKHWQLKAQISWLKEIVQKYVSRFNTHQLIELTFSHDKTALSDIIWAIK